MRKPDTDVILFQVEKKTLNYIFLLIFVSALLLPSLGVSGKLEKENSAYPEHYQPYLDFLEKVYKTMNQNYYQPVSKQVYNIYIEKYKKSVLSKLPPTHHKIDRIAYIGAGLMVENLKNSDDEFSSFIPPKEAKEYSKKVYGYAEGIGITGSKIPKGYLIEDIEIRSDTYEKGIRTGDIILKIDGIKIASLSEDELHKSLHPPLGSIVNLEVFHPPVEKTTQYKVECKKFFKETVSGLPTEIPHVFCLRIEKFNKKTAEDLKRYISDFLNDKIELLILDLRGNPGGPPLAVHELSGIFLKPETKLFYYKKRKKIVAALTAPESEIRYQGRLAVLINKGSGSASELLAATFKEYDRALICGKEKSAGFTFLKHAFDFDDGSMLTLITGFAYLADGTKLGTEGVQPNYPVPEETSDTLQFILNKFKEGDLPLK